MSGLGVVTGLKAEAACLSARAQALSGIYCAGGSGARAHDGALKLANEGATALLSFGVAGGLDPNLVSGDIVIAAAVVDPDGTYFDTDPDWRHRVASLGISVTLATVAGSDCVLSTAAEKAEYFKATGAAAVDMESHGVAAAARALGLPFMAIRAVGDHARGAVPTCAIAGMSPDGGTHLKAVLQSLKNRPWEVFALISLANQTRHGLKSLRRIVSVAAADGVLGYPQ